jgi:hypothetical protein
MRISSQARRSGSFRVLSMPGAVGAVIVAATATCLGALPNGVSVGDVTQIRPLSGRAPARLRAIRARRNSSCAYRPIRGFRIRR